MTTKLNYFDAVAAVARGEKVRADAFFSCEYIQRVGDEPRLFRGGKDVGTGPLYPDAAYTLYTEPHLTQPEILRALADGKRLVDENENVRWLERGEVLRIYDGVCNRETGVTVNDLLAMKLRVTS